MNKLRIFFTILTYFDISIYTKKFIFLRIFELDGSAQNSVTTDVDGNYTFANLPADGSFIIKPVSTTLSFGPTDGFIDALTSDVGGIDFQAFAPTAAMVEAGGRVLTDTGQEIPYAKLQMNDPNGIIRNVTTNSFGYYRFDNVEAGETHIISIAHKNYQFGNPTQVINVLDSITNLNFIADN